MTRTNINCQSCARSWSLPARPSIYERQAIESRPCPGCGAYTLHCSDTDQPRQLPRPFRSPRRRAV